MSPARALLGIATLLLVSGCSRESRLNVLVVTLDTTRADRLGCYGYSEPSSPNIDELAVEGTLFTQAFCTNPITLPSHTSILTGTYPLFHGVRDNSTFVVRDDITTLAEILADEGYETAAVVGAFVLDSRFNLDQGFAHYDDRLAEGWSKDEMDLRAANAFGFAERKANLVTAAALDWLKRPRSGPFFMWLHYFDPHQPVNPPEPHHSRFSEPYAAEIAYADEQFGHVLAELKKQDEYDRTLIVVTADHGEGLMDHGEPTHSLLVFDSTMRVPLIVRMPGEPAGQRPDQLASTVDIMPTVLELLGLEVPAEVQGRSLAALVRGSDGPAENARAVYMESMVASLQCGWGTLRALRTASEKLIHGPKPRYYRVDEDPGEVYDLAAREPEEVERLTTELDRWMRRWSAKEASGSIAPADQETLRRLAALGYISGASGVPGAISDSLAEEEGKDDPYEKRWLFDLIGVATENIRTGYDLEGIQQLQQVVSADPDNPAALTHLGKAYLMSAKRPELAMEYFERAIAADPYREEPHYYMCRMLRAAGDLQGARRHAESILEFNPRTIAAFYELAGIYESENDPARAREYLDQVLDIDPSNVAALVRLGTLHGRRNEYEEAAPYFKRALDIEPDSPHVLYNVGIWHLLGEDVEEAIASLSRAVMIDPSHPSANYVLGKLLYEREETARARQFLLKARQLTQRPDRRQAIDEMLQSIDGSP